jgi:hypothetical protein
MAGGTTSLRGVSLSSELSWKSKSEGSQIVQFGEQPSSSLRAKSEKSSIGLGQEINSERNARRTC